MERRTCWLIWLTWLNRLDLRSLCLFLCFFVCFFVCLSGNSSNRRGPRWLSWLRMAEHWLNSENAVSLQWPRTPQTQVMVTNLRRRLLQPQQVCNIAESHKWVWVAALKSPAGIQPGHRWRRWAGSRNSTQRVSSAAVKWLSHAESSSPSRFQPIRGSLS